MIVEHDIDAPAAYDEKRRELVALARRLDDDELRTIERATPAWSVQDVLAHVIGIAADLNAQRFDGDPDAWTASASPASAVSSCSGPWAAGAASARCGPCRGRAT